MAQYAKPTLRVDGIQKESFRVSHQISKYMWIKLIIFMLYEGYRTSKKTDLYDRMNWELFNTGVAFFRREHWNANLECALDAYPAIRINHEPESVKEYNKLITEYHAKVEEAMKVFNKHFPEWPEDDEEAHQKYVNGLSQEETTTYSTDHDDVMNYFVLNDDES